MYEAQTRGILVRVTPHYLEQRSDPQSGRYFWAYTVEIENRSTDTIQLLTRYWHIADAHGNVEEVRGPGVVGETPVIRAGDSYAYTSGCPLPTPSGIMSGHYGMTTPSGETFDIEIPAFSLDCPDLQRTLN